MFPIAIEEQVKTTRWPIRLFQFILAVTEVNVNYVLHHICDVKLEEQVDFRYKLGLEMIHKEYIENETRKSSSNAKDKTIGAHKLVGIPPYMTFKNGKLVACKTHYIQLKCPSCPNMKV